MAIVDRPLLTSSERVPTFDVTGWALRIGIAAVFIWVGVSKLQSDPLWVKMFNRIGFGDWFRYLTGALQIAGGLLFLIPQTVYAGAVLAGITMLGAVIAHFTLLGTGIGGAIIPLALLIFVVAVAMRRPD